MRIEILTKNDKDMIEISEKKLRELIKDSYNDGYSNGYENGKKHNYWYNPYYGDTIKTVPYSTATSTDTITSNAKDSIYNVTSGKITLANNDSSLTINDSISSIKNEAKNLGYKFRELFIDENGNAHSVDKEEKNEV